MADKHAEALIDILLESQYPIHVVEASYPRRLDMDTLCSLLPSARVSTVGTVPSCLAQVS